jgi:hypothetical protein
MAKLTGGGINSRVNVKPPVRTGGPNRAASPSGVGQIGQTLGNIKGGKLRPAEPIFQGSALQSTLGNAKALDVGAGGPGAGRVTMRSGSQMQHGPSTGSVRPGRTGDLLREFGKDVPGKGGK